MTEPFEQILMGGHPNSLGRTLEVVDLVLAHLERFEELFDCYQSSDEVVRLRTSNAIKRVQAEHPKILLPYIDRLIEEISAIDQASTQWTIAQLFDRLKEDLNPAQRAAAIDIMKRNLANYQDWIVLNATTEVLATWAQEDSGLKTWILPHLERLSQDKRKSVASRAKKKIALLMN